MKKYFTAFLAFIIYFNVFSQAHAAKNYNVKTIVYDPLEKVINATVLDQIAEKTMRRSAKVPVTASATGSTVASMIRMGIAGAAIYGIIKGVGWVIENGVVKKPINNTIENWEYIYYCNATPGQSAISACNTYLAQAKQLGYYQSSMNVSSCTSVDISTGRGTCLFSDGKTSFNITYTYKKNPNYVPSTTLVPVSETEIGNEVNNSPQAPQVLPDVYNPNNSAGGKAPEATSEALDRAVPVPETDPTGSTEVNPETGKGTFKLPAFCEWASVMCAWYQKYQEDSKKTDLHREQEKDVWSQEKTARDEEKTSRQEEKQHREQEKDVWSQEKITREEEKQHRETQKSFWQKVTDWFDWTKEEPEKEQEPDTQEIDDQGIFSRTFDTVFSLSKQCPPDVPYTLETQYLKGNFTISLNWLCVIFTFLGYPLQLIAHLTGLWILYETVVRKEIKW